MRAFLLAALAATVAAPAFAGGPAVTDAFAFATAKTAKAGGAYIDLASGGAEDRLIAARSDVSKRVEIHEHRNDNGVMRMREVEGGIPLPAGGAIDMEPGGYHVMLMGLHAPLEVGQSFPVTLVFESGAEVEVDVAVKKRGAHGMKHGGGHSGGDATN
ncbi:MAG: copper chaperone PCu(A)C [Pseudomonadota bacterium]